MTEHGQKNLSTGGNQFADCNNFTEAYKNLRESKINIKAIGDIRKYFQFQHLCEPEEFRNKKEQDATKHAIKHNRKAMTILFLEAQMKEAGFDGRAFEDLRTISDWKKEGFIVKKGEHAAVFNAWFYNENQKKDEEQNNDQSPKFRRGVSFYFHRSQVEFVGVKEAGIKPKKTNEAEATQPAPELEKVEITINPVLDIVTEKEEEKKQSIIDKFRQRLAATRS